MKIFLIILFVLPPSTIFAKDIDLFEALAQVLKNHPLIESAKNLHTASSKEIRPLYYPDNPMLGFMKENEMKSWSVSQEILFPSKYFNRANIQTKRSLIAKEELINKKLEVRQQVISAFYTLFMLEKNLEYLNAQKDLLREIARIAESRRITGHVSAQDEMKAHFEQANLEKDLLVAQQDIASEQARIKEYFGIENPLNTKNLPIPSLTVSTNELVEQVITPPPILNMASLYVEEASAMKKLARDNFLPDFKITFQKSLEQDSDEKSIALEMKIPLWFFAKESGEYSSASAKSASAVLNHEETKRRINFEQRSLGAKIIAKQKLLKLYTTTLIPQAESTINSSRFAYKSGRTSFMELLDSERTLYGIHISYYQELKDFSETLASFERLTGKSISTLPFGDIL